MPKPIPAVQPIEKKLSTKLDALNWSRVSNTTGQSIAELYFRKFGNNAEKLLREHAELPPEPDEIESFTSMKARTGDMTSQAAKQHSLMLWTSEKELFDKQKQRRDNEIERRSNMISIMEENCQGPVKAIWHDACAKKGELNCDFHAVWLEWRKRMRAGSKATRQAIKTHMKRLRVTDTVEQFIERIHQCTDGFLESFPEGTEPRPIPADLVWEAVKRAIEQRGFYFQSLVSEFEHFDIESEPMVHTPTMQILGIPKQKFCMQLVFHMIPLCEIKQQAKNPPPPPPLKGTAAAAVKPPKRGNMPLLCLDESCNGECNHLHFTTSALTKALTAAKKKAKRSGRSNNKRKRRDDPNEVRRLKAELKRARAGSKPDCRNWANNGECRFGNKCRFKHDPSKKGNKPDGEAAPAIAGEGEVEVLIQALDDSMVHRRVPQAIAVKDLAKVIDSVNNTEGDSFERWVGSKEHHFLTINNNMVEVAGNWDDKIKIPQRSTIRAMTQIFNEDEQSTVSTAEAGYTEPTLISCKTTICKNSPHPAGPTNCRMTVSSKGERQRDAHTKWHTLCATSSSNCKIQLNTDQIKHQKSLPPSQSVEQHPPRACINVRDKKFICATASPCACTTLGSENLCETAPLDGDAQEGSGESFSQPVLVMTDCGANIPIIKDRQMFSSLKVMKASFKVADSSLAESKGVGIAKLIATTRNNKLIMLTLRNAHWVPSAPRNILPPQCFEEWGLNNKNGIKLMELNEHEFHLTEHNRLLFLLCRKAPRAQVLGKRKLDCNHAEAARAVKLPSQKLLRLHKSLGHCSFDRLRKTLQRHKVTLSNSDKVWCESCARARMRKRKVPKKATKVLKRPGELICTDVWGPVIWSAASPNGFRYCICFVDAFTHWYTLKFMQFKSEVLAKFKEFVEESGVKHLNGFDLEVGFWSTLRSDNAQEYKSAEFKAFCDERSIKREFSAPYSQHQNGIAESVWATIAPTAIAALIDQQLPNSWWTMAFSWAAHLHNRLANASNPEFKSPYEMMTGKLPALDHLRPFGSRAVALKEKGTHGRSHKLAESGEMGFWVGFADDQGIKAHLLYMPRTKSVWPRVHVKIFEPQTYNPDLQIAEDLGTHDFKMPGVDQSDRLATWLMGKEPPLRPVRPSLSDGQQRIQQGIENDPWDEMMEADVPTQEEVETMKMRAEKAKEKTPKAHFDEEAFHKLLNSTGYYEKFPQHDPANSSKGKQPEAPAAPMASDSANENRQPINATAPMSKDGEETPPTQQTAPRTQSQVAREKSQSRKCATKQQLTHAAKSAGKPEHAQQTLARANKTTKRRGSEPMKVRFVPRKSARIRNTKTPQSTLACPADGGGLELPLVELTDEPDTWAECMGRPDKAEWLLEDANELARVMGTEGFRQLPRDKLPKDARILSVREVYKVKRLANGEIDKRRVRFTARGCNEREFIDYTDESKYAPVARYETLRALFAIAAHLGMHLMLLDIGAAYLNSDLDEPKFLLPPRRHQERNKHGKLLFWEIHKSLYGLVRAGALWHENIRQTLLDFGFIQSPVDPCLLVLRENARNGLGKFQPVPAEVQKRRRLTATTEQRKTLGEIALMLGLYVDDLPTAYKSKAVADHLLAFLKARYPKVTCEPTLTFILGINVTQNEHGISISLSKYMREMMKDSQLEFTRHTAATPLIPGTGMAVKGGRKPTTGKPPTPLSAKQHSWYRKMCGKLNWCVSVVRMDLSQAANYLSRYMQAPTTEHLSALIHTLRYCNQTKDLGIHYPRRLDKRDVDLDMYCDASHATCPDTGRSFLAYIGRVNGAALTWRTERISRVDMDSTRAELHAMCRAITKANHIQDLMLCLDVRKRMFQINTDNKAVRDVANMDKLSERMCDEMYRVHYVREHTLRDKSVMVNLIGRNLQIADALTKACTPPIFQLMVGETMCVTSHFYSKADMERFALSAQAGETDFPAPLWQLLEYTLEIDGGPKPRKNKSKEKR